MLFKMEYVIVVKMNKNMKYTKQKCNHKDTIISLI